MKQNKEEAQVVIMQREKHPPRQIDQTNYKQREREGTNSYLKDELVEEQHIINSLYSILYST